MKSFIKKGFNLLLASGLIASVLLQAEVTNASSVPFTQGQDISKELMIQKLCNQ